MDTDATRALIEELLETYNEPNLDRAALLYAEDCEYVNRVAGIRVEGRDAQRANMQASFDAFPDRKLHPLRVVADGGERPWKRSSWPRAPGAPASSSASSPIPEVWVSK